MGAASAGDSAANVQRAFDAADVKLEQNSETDNAAAHDEEPVDFDQMLLAHKGASDEIGAGNRGGQTGTAAEDDADLDQKLSTPDSDLRRRPRSESLNRMKRKERQRMEKLKVKIQQKMDGFKSRIVKLKQSRTVLLEQNKVLNEMVEELSAKKMKEEHLALQSLLDATDNKNTNAADEELRAREQRRRELKVRFANAAATTVFTDSARAVFRKAWSSWSALMTMTDPHFKRSVVTLLLLFIDLRSLVHSSRRKLS